MFLFCLVFAMSLCASVYMCSVVTCWEMADLLALVCGVCCEFVTFPLVSWCYDIKPVRKEEGKSYWKIPLCDDDATRER